MNAIRSGSRPVRGAVFLAGALCAAISRQAGGFPAVRTYDENVIATNVVDFTATGSSMTAAQFATTVGLAYDNDRGGVLDGSAVGGQTNIVEFGATGTRSLTYEVPTNWAIGISGDGGTAISTIGTWSALSTPDITRPRVIFEFPNDVEGGASNERVVQLGLTVLSSGLGKLGTVTGLATFSGGGTQLATAQIPLSLATHDTFFGFIAPADQWITRLDVSAYNNGQANYPMRFDDLGFVTKSFIPEPTSWLLAAFGFAMLGRRRAMSARCRQA